MNMRELKKLSDASEFSRMYMFYGEETFLAAFYSRRLRDKINEKYGMSDFNYMEFDGERLDTDEFFAAAESVPVFAEKKCVFVKDFDFGALGAQEGKAFVDFCRECPETTVLIFTYVNLHPSSADKKWKDFFCLLGDCGVIAECPAPSRGELSAWLRQAAALNGGQLDASAAEYIIDRVGTDMRRLRGEICKMAAHSNGVISREDVDAVGIKHLDAKVYDMVKCISAGKFSEAYELLDMMLEIGEEPSMILGAVSGTFADIYRAKLGADCGLSANRIAEDFGMKGRDFRIRNAMRYAYGFSDAYIEKCVEAIADADAQLKASGTDGRIALEKMIAAIAAAGAANER